MIEINITVFVQIFHFLVAYVLLRKFLWRPAIERLDEYAQVTVSLKKEVDERKQQADFTQTEIAQVWQEARQVFALHAPSFARHALAQRYRAQIKQHASPTVANADVREIAALIVQRARQ